MIPRLLAAVCCFLLVGLAAGCGAAAPDPTRPTASPSSPVVTVPADGVLLSSLGFAHAPRGFSVPATSVITERVDQANTIVAVFTSPSGLDIAGYLRANLPEQGWEITADGNNSLLFERGEVHGAFTVSGAWAALSIRFDEKS